MLIRAFRFHPCRRLCVAQQRVGLIRQGKNHIGLIFAGAFVLINHGYAVEQVSGIDHDSGNGCGQDGYAAGEQPNAHILHRPGIDKKANVCYLRVVSSWEKSYHNRKENSTQKYRL